MEHLLCPLKERPSLARFLWGLFYPLQGFQILGWPTEIERWVTACGWMDWMDDGTDGWTKSFTQNDHDVLYYNNFGVLLLHGGEAGHSTLKEGFLTVFTRGPHCLWCPESRWSPPLCISITLKIGKNGLEVMEGHFYKKISIKQLIDYFWIPQKILKYYSVAFRVTRWFVQLKMVISEQFKSINTKN